MIPTPQCGKQLKGQELSGDGSPLVLVNYQFRLIFSKDSRDVMDVTHVPCKKSFVLGCFGCAKWIRSCRALPIFCYSFRRNGSLRPCMKQTRVVITVNEAPQPVSLWNPEASQQNTHKAFQVYAALPASHIYQHEATCYKCGIAGVFAS